MPSRNARHGHVFTSQGVLNLNNAKYALDTAPLDDACDCPTCRHFDRAYLRHLLKSGEMLALRLLVTHNLRFYNALMEQIREHLEQGDYIAWKKETLERIDRRI